jgi:hypothetical protein
VDEVAVRPQIRREEGDSQVDCTVQVAFVKSWFFVPAWPAIEGVLCAEFRGDSAYCEIAVASIDRCIGSRYLQVGKSVWDRS